MLPYFEKRGYKLSSTLVYHNHSFPEPDEFDWLIVMGGPMSVNDEGKYKWMPGEKTLIADSIAAGKTVLGVCLGAQMIADVLGAGIHAGEHREIGWFPIEPAPPADDTVLKGVIPPGIEAFHWHGETFDIPAGAVHLASSEACRNQGFIVGDRVVALQFHLETTREAAEALIENCGDELEDSEFVQGADEILAEEERFPRINAVMTAILDRLAE
jgi:GMP synthase-like glutamine amidotransferase